MRKLHWALAPLAAIALAACGDGDGAADGAATTATEPSSETLAAVIEGHDDLDTVERMLDSAGLTEVMNGVGPYTVFAPADDAFESAEGASALAGEEAAAHAAALLRAHIVPGALTRRDIAAALDQAEDGRVEMRTMDDGVLVFSREDGVIWVAAEDGARARLAGEEELARNGALQPVDGLLRRLDAPAG